MFLPRTNGKIPYIDGLCAILMNRLTQWRGQELIEMDAYLYNRPQLKAEFRYVRNTGAYWSSIRNERQYRSKLGRAVPYQCLALFEVRDSYKERAF